MQKTAEAVLKELGVTDPVFDVARELEQIALNDEYFIEKKLYPNVDFYSGVILSAIGFPTSMFTALFALARTVGWVAQWNEMISDPDQKIGRPRQLYTGRRSAITCRSPSVATGRGRRADPVDVCVCVRSAGAPDEEERPTVRETVGWNSSRAVFTFGPRLRAC
jgi:hypothetical protein